MRHNKKPETSTHYPLTIALILVFITLWNCRSTVQNNDQAGDLESLTKRTLGKDHLIEFNDTKTFALCQQNPLADHFRKKYRYIIIRTSDNAIVHEGNFSMGYAKWLDNDSIKVFSISKNGKEESSTKKIINVNSHRQ